MFNIFGKGSYCDNYNQKCIIKYKSSAVAEMAAERQTVWKWYGKGPLYERCTDKNGRARSNPEQKRNHIDTFNWLSTTHQCDIQADGQTNRYSHSNGLHRVLDG